MFMDAIQGEQWMQRLASIHPSGLRHEGKLLAHDHAALVYWSRQEFLDTIVPFLVDGIRAGDLVVHIAHDEPLAPVVDALADAGIDVASAAAQGRLMLLSAQQAFAPNGRFDLEAATAGIKAMIEAAQLDGARQVRFSVDISYVLSGTPGIEDFMVLDARANDDIFPSQPFICVCAYNAARGSNHMVEDMFLTHPLVFVRGIPMANPYYQLWAQISSRADYLQRWKARYSAVASGAAT
ncbi:MEDS domain-containing protein [Azohydromonas lata]|uniref:MEDS domain-containing protein n=1 Tax=Azohydromonas lata TaxID=45677 RepID=A0ABU5IDM7_9BURK|nr:MEDS domain-containing protein [Azohydromonas lata]MDZ5456765.1 MEDS domain-containing protein [Azohydromonas lata]